MVEAGRWGIGGQPELHEILSQEQKQINKQTKLNRGFVLIYTETPFISEKKKE